MALYFCQTPLGCMGIEEENNAIIAVAFNNEPRPELINTKPTALTQEAILQLNAYFAGTLKIFSLPLAPAGTVFQKKIWQLLSTIPYGETFSYKDLAIAAGNVKAVRAVGQANNKNPIPIFIPCHRVIGSNGKLVGYRGGLAMKAQLLAIEQHSS